MSTPRVLLVEDATFHNVAPLAIEHIKVAFEAEGCQTDLVQESKAMDFQPSFFDLPARRNLKRLIELPSDIVIAAGPRAHILLKQARRDFRSWSPKSEVEPGIPIPLLPTPRAAQHPPQALGICSSDTTTQRAAQLVAEELDLLLVDLTDQKCQADITLHSTHESRSHLHALDLILSDRPADDLPALRAALCGVAIVGPGVCNDEPFDHEAIDDWRTKSRQLLENHTLRLSHAQAWSAWLTERHNPQTIAQRLLGGLPLLQPKMN